MVAAAAFAAARSSGAYEDEGVDGDGSCAKIARRALPRAVESEFWISSRARVMAARSLAAMAAASSLLRCQAQCVASLTSLDLVVASADVVDAYASFTAVSSFATASPTAAVNAASPRAARVATAVTAASRSGKVPGASPSDPGVTP